MNVFAYGTLIEPVLVRSLLGHENFKMFSGTMPGYRKDIGPGGYWYARQDPDSILEGTVITNLNEADMVVLRRYEAGLYDEVIEDAETQAEGPGCMSIPCHMFIAKPDTFS